MTPDTPDDAATTPTDAPAPLACTFAVLLLGFPDGSVEIAPLVDGMPAIQAARPVTAHDVIAACAVATARVNTQNTIAGLANALAQAEAQQLGAATQGPVLATAKTLSEAVN